MTDLQIQMMDRLDTATFDELADFVQTSVLNAEAHAKKSIECLIAVGGALCEMRDRMPGQYHAWLEAVGIQKLWASRCQRLYTYRESLPTEALQEYKSASGKTHQPNLSSALKSVSQLPILSRGPRGERVDTDDIRRLLVDGVSVTEIARLIGCTSTTVYNIKNPGAAAARDQRRAKRVRLTAATTAALKKQQQREERDRLAKATGNELSVAYALVRQALAALAKMGSPTDPRHSNRASDYLSAAETALVGAMRAERTQ